MFDVGRDQDTICALSTAAGAGGISVLRVSGSRGAEVVRKVSPFLPEQLKSHTVYFGTLRESDSHEAIDEVLVSFFETGRSYTGEETLEISCHGSRAIAQTILDELVKAGGRIAERGEFTYRAFMNGRIDLVQAEGVLSLVESQSKPAARLALRQLKGNLSRKFQTIEDGLVWLLARLEVSLDFSGEDIEVAPKDLMLQKIKGVLTDCESLISTYSQGRILKEGLNVALVGRPNVGKSSLLNAILGEDRAIVTDIAGTTRDTIEGRTRVNGFPVTLVDTAGVRETQDPIEKIGVQKTKETAAGADFNFVIVDGADGFTPEDEDLLNSLPKEKTFVVVNKADLVDAGTAEKLRKNIEARFEKVKTCLVSSKTKFGLNEIEAFLSAALERTMVEDSDVVIQTRHFQLLRKLKERVEKARVLIGDGVSEEFSALELRIALTHAHEILGTEIDEQIIDRIFGDFCIGK
ncbi:MAG: tRNA uridine-5-carboxymethylaminomethyl(34) synthesis GTPase MnmE [Bdellovibrionia bacterium]